jgi:branched-chain amino acid transport system substrate-binding protein
MTIIKQKRFWFGFCLFIVLSAVILIAIKKYNDESPVKFGFVGCLTGRLSDLGISGRDGAILAVERINNSGGINGIPVKLVIKDDKQNSTEAVKVVKELIDEGVVAIIGHMTSSMSMSSLPVINEAQVVMMSPTTSTNDISGIDDYFFRVMQPNRTEIEHLAEYTYRNLKIKKLASVYDLSNRAYSEEWFIKFKKEFEELGGRLTYIEPYNSSEKIKYSETASNIINSDTEAVLLIAGALDTAMICQHLKKFGSEMPVISAGWAMTDDLLRHGGLAVEGIATSQIYDSQSKSNQFIQFRKQFFQRFGREPDFGSAFAYEAAGILFEAYSKTPDKLLLKKTIIEQKIFQGLQGSIELDLFGDAIRKRFIVIVKNNKYITI